MKEIKTGYPTQQFHSSFPLINAVVAGLQEGKVFSEDGSFFVFHKSGFSYLGDKPAAGYPATLDFLLQPGLLPDYFHIYDAPDGLITACHEQADRVNIKLRKRIQLKFQDQAPRVEHTTIPGYTLAKIDGAGFEKLLVFNLLLENKFWKSKDDFLANGFGFVINNESGMPVSICYSATVADKTAEIDVATLPGYQKKGLAKMVVTGFVQHCLENGITANWDCFEDNYGSLKTAESIGFKKITMYDFLSIFNKTGKS